MGAPVTHRDTIGVVWGGAMRIGSLFSGIGGLERGLEMAGVGRVVWQVEREPFCRGVLAKHWPEAVRYDDVCTVGAAFLSPVDVICGGFPCQDVSVAGAGAGLAGARSGLWREYARIVGELRPRFVVVENVPGLIRRGLDVVVGDLCDIGYAVEGTRIRAGDVGAPHRRERVFLLARRVADPSGGGWPKGRRGGQGAGAVDCDRLGDPYGAGLEVDGDGDAGQRPPAVGAGGRAGAVWHAQPRLGRGADGLADWLDATRWPAGRGERQHDWESPRTIPARSVPQRGARVKALGNAVVSQCAYIVGRRLLEWA